MLVADNDPENINIREERFRYTTMSVITFIFYITYASSNLSSHFTLLVTVYLKLEPGKNLNCLEMYKRHGPKIHGRPDFVSTNKNNREAMACPRFGHKLFYVECGNAIPEILLTDLVYTLINLHLMFRHFFFFL